LRCFGRTKLRGAIAARNCTTFDIRSSFASSMESGSSVEAEAAEEARSGPLVELRGLIDVVLVLLGFGGTGEWAKCSTLLSCGVAFGTML